MYHVKIVTDYLDKEGIPYSMTGSYEIGGYQEGTSDIDIVVRWRNQDFDDLQNSTWNFERGGSANHDHLTESWKATFDDSSKFPDINLILVSNDETYSSWVTATKLSKALGLHQKAHRVAMFEYWKNKADSMKPQVVDFC